MVESAQKGELMTTVDLAFVDAAAKVLRLHVSEGLLPEEVGECAERIARLVLNIAINHGLEDH